MCLLIVRGSRKVALLPALPKLREKLALSETLLLLPLFPICPSQWTQADDGFEWKMDGGSKRRTGDRKNRRAGEGVRERCMAAHIASDRMTDEGIMEQGYFPQ